MDPFFLSQVEPQGTFSQRRRGGYLLPLLLIILVFSACENLGDPITDQSSIEILAPTGGEEFCTDSAIEITWEAVDLSEINIQYTYNGGSTWSDVIPTVSASERSYFWTPLIASDNYRLRIQSANDNVIRNTSEPFMVHSTGLSFESISNTSDAKTFSELTIKWKNFCTGNVNVEISLDNGSNWELVATDYPDNAYYWESVPEQYVSDEVRFRISSVADPSTSTVSPDVFSIAWEREIPISEVSFGETIESDIWGPYTIIGKMGENDVINYYAILLTCGDDCGPATYDPTNEQFTCFCDGATTTYNKLGCGIDDSNVRLNALRTFVNNTTNKLVVRGLLEDGSRCE